MAYDTINNLIGYYATSPVHSVGQEGFTSLTITLLTIETSVLLAYGENAQEWLKSEDRPAWP